MATAKARWWEGVRWVPGLQGGTGREWKWACLQWAGSQSREAVQGRRFCSRCDWKTLKRGGAWLA